MRIMGSPAEDPLKKDGATASRHGQTKASEGAPWLELLNDGTFPVGNDPSFNYARQQIPLPNEMLRQTVSRRDFGGFYFIGESWALAVSRLLARVDRDRYRVLDMGCGVGKTARFLALDSRIHYIGFDIFKPAIEWCRTAFRVPVGDRFRFVHFDGISKFYNPTGTIRPSDYEFPVEDGSIDVAFAASLFTHLLEEDMRAYLRQCAAKLAPDGFALLSIKEAPHDAPDAMTGTEQSIRLKRDFFVSAAAESGLRLEDAGYVIGGQRALVFSRS